MSGLGFDRLFTFFSQLGTLPVRYTLPFADALMATHNSSRVTGKYVRGWVRRWRIEELERKPATRGWVRRWRIEEPPGSIVTVCRQQQNLALEICGGIGRGLIGMRRPRAGLDKRRSQHEDRGYVSWLSRISGRAIQCYFLAKNGYFTFEQLLFLDHVKHVVNMFA